MLKASFVIPWYGREIPGGAEAECRGVAENLAARGVPVEVLTTCLHSHGRSWDADFHSPGESRENGVLVRRFPIDRRNAELFNLLNRRLLAGQLLPPRQEKAFLDNMVNSRALYHFISEAKNRLFLPLPYLFSTTWMTARLAPDRTAPLTCLHDEGYAYLQHLPADLPFLPGARLPEPGRAAIGPGPVGGGGGTGTARGRGSGHGPDRRPRFFPGKIPDNRTVHPLRRTAGPHQEHAPADRLLCGVQTDPAGILA